MDGPQLKKLHQKLLVRFPNEGALTQMVRFNFNENLYSITLASNLKEKVFQLINWAEAEGKLDDLVTIVNNCNEDLYSSSKASVTRVVPSKRIHLLSKLTNDKLTCSLEITVITIVVSFLSLLTQLIYFAELPTSVTPTRAIASAIETQIAGTVVAKQTILAMAASTATAQAVRIGRVPVFGIVNTDGIEVHSAPGASSPKIKSLEGGTLIFIRERRIAENTIWDRITIEHEDGFSVEGWVEDTFIKEVQ